MKQTVITATGYYTIAGAAGAVIEAVESAENGAAVQLGAYEAKKATQEWKFIREGEGAYRIQNRATGKMIDLVMTGTVNGTWLHQWEDMGASSQVWIVERTADGKIKLLSQLANGKCIDTVDMYDQPGARLQIWDDVNGANQLWTLTKVVARRTTKKAAEGETAEKKTTTRKTTKKAEGETAVKKTTARKTTKKAEGEAAVKKTTTRKTTKKAAEQAE